MLLKRWCKWFAICTLLIGVLPLSAFAAPSVSPGETFLVTNINDSGDGSLRRAILDANAHPGSDSIRFNVNSDRNSKGMYVITVESLLPPITEALTIDGGTQLRHSEDNGPVIEINGVQVVQDEKSCAGVESGVYRDFPGLDIVNNSDGDASGTTIKGLKISHFCEGISISAGLDEPRMGCPSESHQQITHVTVQKNVLENNLGGNAALDLCLAENSTLRNNKFASNGDQIEITASEHVLVEKNEGVDAQDAVELIGSHHITIRNNRFSNNSRGGVVLFFGASDNRILNNEISDMHRPV